LAVSAGKIGCKSTLSGLSLTAIRLILVLVLMLILALFVTLIFPRLIAGIPRFNNCYAG
jgi:hypothetical protein